MAGAELAAEGVGDAVIHPQPGIGKGQARQALEPVDVLAAFDIPLFKGGRQPREKSLRRAFGDGLAVCVKRQDAK